MKWNFNVLVTDYLILKYSKYSPLKEDLCTLCIDLLIETLMDTSLSV